jgi:outer membrane cobalamin receptor
MIFKQGRFFPTALLIGLLIFICLPVFAQQAAEDNDDEKVQPPLRYPENITIEGEEKPKTEAEKVIDTPPGVKVAPEKVMLEETDRSQAVIEETGEKKEAESQQVFGRDFFLEVYAGLGGDSTFEGGAHVGQCLDIVDYLVKLDHYNTDGWQENGAKSQTSLDTELGFNVGEDWHLFLNLSGLWKDNELPAVPDDVDPTRSQAAWDMSFAIGMEKEFSSGGAVRFNFFQSVGNIENEAAGGGPFDDKIDGTKTGIDAFWRLAPMGQHDLSFYTNMYLETLSDKNDFDEDTFDFQISAEDRWRFGESPFQLNIGIGAETQSDRGKNLTIHNALQWALNNDTELEFKIGRSALYPQYRTTYIDHDFVLLTEDLEEQESSFAGVSARYHVDYDFIIDGGITYNKYKDFIAYGEGSGDFRGLFGPGNIDEAEVTEFTIGANWTAANGFNISSRFSRYLVRDLEFRNNYLPFYPATRFNLEFKGETGPLSGVLALNYYGRQHFSIADSSESEDGYVKADVRGELQLLDWLHAYAKLTNIMDQEYLTHPNYEGQGINLIGGLRAQF